MACFDDKAPDFSEKSILFVSISFQMKMVEIGVNQILSELIYNIKLSQVSENFWVRLDLYENIWKNCKIISNFIQLFMKNYWHLEKN